MADALAVTDQTDPLADVFDPKSMPQPSEIDPMIGDAQSRVKQADRQVDSDRVQQGRDMNALGGSNRAYQAAASGRKPPPDMPPAPDNRLTMEAAGTWIAAATVFGAIAGALTRRSSTNALAAFTGSLEGLKEGNQIKFEQSSKVWEQENKRIYQQWKMQDDSMQRILDDKKMDMDTKRFMIQQDSMKYRDDVMAKAAAQGDYVQMITLKDRRSDSIQKARQSFAQLQSALETRREQQEMREWRMQNYGTDEMVRRTALRGFATGRQGDTVRSFSVALSHMDILQQLADATKNGDVKAINAAKNRWQSEFGSPAPDNLNFAAQFVGDEVLKAVIGSGAGTGGDRDRLQAAFVNASKSPDQIYGALDTARSLMAGQLDGYRRQYIQTSGRSAEDFDALLSPAARRLVGGGESQPKALNGGGPTTAPPPQAIQMLRQNPALRDKFDEKYGPGAAARALGNGA